MPRGHVNDVHGVCRLPSRAPRRQSNPIVAQSPFFVCLRRGVLMPITNMIWRGQVGAPQFGAYDVVYASN